MKNHIQKIYRKYKICKNNLKQKCLGPVLHKLQNVTERQKEHFDIFMKFNQNVSSLPIYG